MLKVTRDANTIRVVSPYLPAFVAAAKRLGGRWQAPAWVFDARDDARVREALLQHYGTDGAEASGPVVTLRVVWKPEHSAYSAPIRLAGREIAKAFGRDSGARICEGVVLLEGNFGSGGSVKNWKTCVGSKGATVLVRDVPATWVQRLADEPADGVVSVEVEPEEPVIDREALAAERGRLVARLAEIDKLLGA
ncbi:hypothetical protein [Piscinibacter sakaiensis]|uniref:Uncharacterized protein n=1 Tax=Piscinibacter sakaiensis TaxID=1547922 RepID=A0A0K8P5J4_PISS1|nr:hypothetical protein [Piscinibacter sakaiensis]GAP37882.1 hypothetical protein ISF6_4076 [Piscinibacter sakaiensis]